MARPVFIEFENAFYHVASRGINRQKLFRDPEDHDIFIRLLRKLVFKYNIRLFAFCLMGNHYHLYFSTPDANLSKFMKALNQSYAIYFLKKYPDKNGTVYKGRYMRKLVEADQYSLTLITYIHNNPYKLIGKVEDWSYSSYSSYLNPSGRLDFIDYDFSLASFGNSIQRFKAFHDQMRKRGWDPEDHTIARSFIGSEEFAIDIVQKYLNIDHINNEEILGIDFFRTKPNPNSILKFIASLSLDYRLKIQLEQFILKEYYGYSLKELGQKYQTKDKTIGQRIRRFKIQVRESTELQAILDKVTKCRIVET